MSAAAAGLLEAGLKFLDALSAPDTPLVRNDPETNRPMLAIPLPEGFSAERLLGALGGLLRRVTGAGSRA